MTMSLSVKHEDDYVGTQIDPMIYVQVLENWGLYMRLNGMKRLSYKPIAPFFRNKLRTSIEPNEREAMVCEQSLLAMRSQNKFYSDWLVNKFYHCLSDHDMCKAFSCSYPKAKQNKMVALTAFGMCYELVKKIA